MNVVRMNSVIQDLDATVRASNVKPCWQLIALDVQLMKIAYRMLAATSQTADKVYAYHISQ